MLRREISHEPIARGAARLVLARADGRRPTADGRRPMRSACEITVPANLPPWFAPWREFRE
jgi:hypothetical protein